MSYPFFHMQTVFAKELVRAKHDFPADINSIDNYGEYVMRKAHQTGYTNGGKVFQRGLRGIIEMFPAKPKLGNGLKGGLKGKGLSFIKI